MMKPLPRGVSRALLFLTEQREIFKSLLWGYQNFDRERNKKFYTIGCFCSHDCLVVCLYAAFESIPIG